MTRHLTTYYRRPLPTPLVALSATEGRRLFTEALAAGDMEGWFALAEQFHTQADPAFCGLGSLVVVLNALQIDPGRIWKGPWRWYSEELLDCCVSLEDVRRAGITLGELACLARCNGANANTTRAEGSTIEQFRADVQRAASSPHGPMVIASYSRQVVGQTGDGHFSPVAGFHADRDLALVLDVARFKYPPHWIPLSMLWDAMNTVDPTTNQSRGWVVLTRSEGSTSMLLSVGENGTLREGIDLVAAVRAAFNRGERNLDTSIRELNDAIGSKLCTRFAMHEESGDCVLPAHRAAIDTLLSELRSVGLYARVVHVLGAQLPPMRAELLTLLLAALPPEWYGQSDVEPFDPARTPNLAAEVSAVHEQLRALGTVEE